MQQKVSHRDSIENMTYIDGLYIYVYAYVFL